MSSSLDKLRTYGGYALGPLGAIGGAIFGGAIAAAAIGGAGSLVGAAIQPGDRKQKGKALVIGLGATAGITAGTAIAGLASGSGITAPLTTSVPRILGFGGSGGQVVGPNQQVPQGKVAVDQFGNSYSGGQTIPPNASATIVGGSSAGSGSLTTDLLKGGADALLGGGGPGQAPQQPGGAQVDPLAGFAGPAGAQAGQGGGQVQGAALGGAQFAKIENFVKENTLLSVVIAAAIGYFIVRR